MLDQISFPLQLEWWCPLNIPGPGTVKQGLWSQCDKGDCLPGRNEMGYGTDTAMSDTDSGGSLEGGPSDY